MKKYIASYQNKKDECWDLVLFATDFLSARKTARKEAKNYGRLYSVRLAK